MESLLPMGESRGKDSRDRMDHSELASESSRCDDGEPIQEEVMTVQTIEKTSKTLKGSILACGGFFLLGVCAVMIGGRCFNDPIRDVGLWMILGGIVGVVYVKVLIWWRHG